jgi:hypothetical protein
MENQTNSISLKAEEFIQQATKADNDGDYQQAFELYRKALEFLMVVYKCKSANLLIFADKQNGTARSTLKSKMELLLQRAELLKKMLEKSEQQNDTSLVGPSR